MNNIIKGVRVWNCGKSRITNNDFFKLSLCNRGVTRALYFGGGGGGGGLYIKFISKEIRRAEHKYRNIHPPPPPPQLTL